MTCSNVNNANVQQYATQMSAPAMFSKNSSLGNLKIDGRSFQVRELSGDAIDECLDWVVSIALSIGKFFARRAEDLGMFWSAFISMGNNANSNTIQNRIDALTGFRDWVDQLPEERGNWTVERSAELHQRYRTLGSSARNLLCEVNSEFIQTFGFSSNVGFRELKQILIYECDLAISYQQTLTLVNTFYHAFKDFGAFLGTLIPHSASPVAESLEIIPYAPDSIPSDIQVKVLAIGRLNEQYALAREYEEMMGKARVHYKASEDDIKKIDAMPQLPHEMPSMPENYVCIISMDCMSMPVFDRSHPELQEALKNASVFNERRLQHYIDHTSYENLQSQRAMPDCPACRKTYDQRSMMIDKAFQAEILEFLQSAVTEGVQKVVGAENNSDKSLRLLFNKNLKFLKDVLKKK